MADETKAPEVKEAATGTAPKAQPEQVIPQAAEAVAFDKPVDPTAGEKHKADERVVLAPDGSTVTRKATFAEMGLDTTDEDMSKFIPPVAPSNAPQPKTYVGGVRTDYVPTETEKKSLSEQKKAENK